MQSSNRKSFVYSHPHPAVAVDLAIFTVTDVQLQLLLVRRGLEPFKGRWALPGGFVKIDEGLDEAAKRELREETGIESAYLEQLGAFGDPGRDPRERVVSIVYFAVLSQKDITIKGGGDAEIAQWWSTEKLPKLAFDHDVIVNAARARLADKARSSAIATEFLNPELTLTELQQVHEALLGQELDKRNFRKWASGLEHLRPTGHVRRGLAHRPALLYRARKS